MRGTEWLHLHALLVPPYQVIRVGFADGHGEVHPGMLVVPLIITLFLTRFFPQEIYLGSLLANHTSSFRNNYCFFDFANAFFCF